MFILILHHLNNYLFDFNRKYCCKSVIYCLKKFRNPIQNIFFIFKFILIILIRKFFYQKFIWFINNFLHLIVYCLLKKKGGNHQCRLFAAMYNLLKLISRYQTSQFFYQLSFGIKMWTLLWVCSLISLPIYILVKLCIS